MSLFIGHNAGGDPFELPVELAQYAMAVHGVRGKGKTVTASVIVEELLQHHIQVVVVDPTDVWWGLKSSGDGLGEGFPVFVLGGSNQDLPLLPHQGEKIADFIVDQGGSMILSLRHMRKHDRTRFITDLAEQLYHRKGESVNRRPLVLVLDEASQAVPQRVDASTARMVGAIQDIVRMGRASGFGTILIDQRPATVNKDVLTQIELMVCHAVTSPQDRKALQLWIEGKDGEGHAGEFLESLASLDRGQAWFWMPSQDLFSLVQVRMRETFDSSKTPELGEKPAVPLNAAHVELNALRAALESPGSDGSDGENEGVQKIGKKGDKTHIKRTSPPESRKEGVDPAIVDQLTARIRELEGLVEQLQKLIRRAHAPAAAAARLLEESPAIHTVVIPAGIKLERSEMEEPGQVEELTPETTIHARVVDFGEGAVQLPAPRQAILDALQGLTKVGLDEVLRENVAVFAGQSPKSSAFTAHLSWLSNQDFIEYRTPGTVSITPRGAYHANGSKKTPKTRAQLLEAWLAYLAAGEQRIVKVLYERHPLPLTRSALAILAMSSEKSSAYTAHISNLAKLGLIKYPGPGKVQLTDLLFPPRLK